MNRSICQAVLVAAAVISPRLGYAQFRAIHDLEVRECECGFGCPMPQDLCGPSADAPSDASFNCRGNGSVVFRGRPIRVYDRHLDTDVNLVNPVFGFYSCVLPTFVTSRLWVRLDDDEVLCNLNISAEMELGSVSHSVTVSLPLPTLFCRDYSH